MYYEALKSALRLTAQLNEYTLMLNAWILSPSTTPECRSRRTLLGPTLTSICYGTAEPLYSLLLARIPLDPSFVLLMTTVIHGFGLFMFWSTMNLAADFQLRDAREREHRVQLEKAEEGVPAESELITDGARSTSARKLNWRVLYPFVFAHIQSAAASNAALLLVAQTAKFTEIESQTVHMILLIAGLFYFFLSGLADCYLARAMGLPFCIGQYRAIEVVIPQVANMLLVLMLRGGVRWCLGMETFAGAWGNDARGVEKFAGFAAFLERIGHAPRWLSPVLLVLSGALMYLSTRITAKARTE